MPTAGETCEIADSGLAGAPGSVKPDNHRKPVLAASLAVSSAGRRRARACVPDLSWATRRRREAGS
jgi:hypothetical protein